MSDPEFPDCSYDTHPHPDYPCGREVIPGVTRCTYCGNLDESPECKAAGCWLSIETDADVALVIGTLQMDLAVREASRALDGDS